MRHGRFMGYGYNGSIILLILLILAVIAFIVFIKGFFRARGDNSNQKYLEILNERYAKGEINTDEYREIIALIEDKESEDNEISVLEEQYIRGEISREEFLKKKEQFLN